MYLGDFTNRADRHYRGMFSSKAGSYETRWPAFAWEGEGSETYPLVPKDETREK